MVLLRGVLDEKVTKPTGSFLNLLRKVFVQKPVGNPSWSYREYNAIPFRAKPVQSRKNIPTGLKNKPSVAKPTQQSRY
jgi:hypothetical protein